MRRITLISSMLAALIVPKCLTTSFQCQSLVTSNRKHKIYNCRDEWQNELKMGSGNKHRGQHLQPKIRDANPIFPPHFLPNTPSSTIMQTRATATTNDLGIDPLPEQSSQGVYQIKSEEEYDSLLKAYPNKLVVVKFFASYCRACKVLESKFLIVKNDPQLENLPIIWAEFQSQKHTRDLFQKQLHVMTLPTIHFYDNGGLVENFPCPPSKIPVLKKKLSRFINTRVDPITLEITESDKGSTATEPREQRMLIDNEMITEEHIKFLRNDLPFFNDLTDEEFSTLLQKARVLTFNQGDIIRKQGMPANAFYVIKSGIVEKSMKSRFDDPLSTPPNYLGVVVNTLTEFDFFGERALSTGEPFAASFKALEEVRCIAFDRDDIPPSSILSRKRQATKEIVEQLNQRYILPDDYTPAYPVTQREECILELLVRFKQIRQAAKCFDYIMESEPNWGDVGEIARRTLLVRKLSYSQRNEFNEVFNMVDRYQLGYVSLLEMRKFMASAQKDKSDEELREMINRANPKEGKEANTAITRDEFMGVMAEAEFYNLFRETFQVLDSEKTGYVRAGDLDQVLNGVRDLIADNRLTSIIDVEDTDLLVDYEQFSRMLLGAAL